MPAYCYTTGGGRTVERIFAMGKAPDRVEVDGELAERNYAAEHQGRSQGGCAAWPMKSYAAGVNPSEAKSATEDAQRLGVPTDFCPRTGDAIFTSRKHRKRYCEAKGIHDNNAGYGDPQPR